MVTVNLLSKSNLKTDCSKQNKQLSQEMSNNNASSSKLIYGDTELSRKISLNYKSQSNIGFGLNSAGTKAFNPAGMLTTVARKDFRIIEIKPSSTNKKCLDAINAALKIHFPKKEEPQLEILRVSEKNKGKYSITRIIVSSKTGKGERKNQYIFPPRVGLRKEVSFISGSDNLVQNALKALYEKLPHVQHQ